MTKVRTLIIDEEMLEKIAALSNPHMKAINDAVTAAFPDQPDEMYTLALAFQLVTLLDALHSDDRSNAVNLINALLVRLGGYRLSALS